MKTRQFVFRWLALQMQFVGGEINAREMHARVEKLIKSDLDERATKLRSQMRLVQ